MPRNAPKLVIKHLASFGIDARDRENRGRQRHKRATTHLFSAQRVVSSALYGGKSPGDAIDTVVASVQTLMPLLL